MAKSARAHQRQKNNTALRKNVFGPAEQARAERLSQKLMQIISEPSEREKEKQNETEVEGSKDKAEVDKPIGDEMDIDKDRDAEAKQPITVRKRLSRVQKKRRRKPHSQIVFPQLKKRELARKKKRSKTS